jgi:hypothetical protein
MSALSWQLLAVAVGGFILLTIGMLRLSRREPDTPVRSYVLLVVFVGLGTYLVWGQVEAAFDRQWAINRADSAERALAGQTEWLPRLLTMEACANADLNVGRTERAAQWAQQLLDLAEGHESDRNYGCAIHTGHIILGRIALQRGDVEAGKRHLLAAGDTPGSPTLDSFGPDMLLASQLLALGETATVLQYLDECQAFWHRDELQQWKLAIARNESPAFEANFHF